MKMLDEKGRLFGLVNIIDILIVIAVVVIVAVGYKVLNTQLEPAEEQTQLITMEITKKRESYCKNIQIGEQVMDKVNNVPLGIVKTVSYKPAQEFTVSSIDGAIQNVEVPERFDVTLVLEVPVTEEVQVGKFLSLKAKHFTGSGYVIAVDSQKEAAQ